MKIRIKGNSIRYRLTRTEVETLCTTGYFEEHTHFPNTVFTYGIAVTNTTKKIDASFDSTKILITIASQLVINWASNTTVGFEHTLLLKNGQQLAVLIEKDFVCMDDTREDQSDHYPNPNAT